MKRKRRRLVSRERHAGPIHARLVDLRKAKDLSQDDVAANLGIDKTAVSHWETGTSRPEFERIPTLAELFGVSVLDLIRDEPAYASIQAAMEAA